MPVYLLYIYRCKRVSPAGAQQMLLDLTILCNALKGIINIGDPHRFDEEETARYALC